MPRRKNGNVFDINTSIFRQDDTFKYPENTSVEGMRVREKRKHELIQ